MSRTQIYFHYNFPYYCTIVVHINSSAPAPLLLSLPQPDLQNFETIRVPFIHIATPFNYCSYKWSSTEIIPLSRLFQRPEVSISSHFVLLHTPFCLTRLTTLLDFPFYALFYSSCNWPHNFSPDSFPFSWSISVSLLRYDVIIFLNLAEAYFKPFPFCYFCCEAHYLALSNHLYHLSYTAGNYRDFLRYRTEQMKRTLLKVNTAPKIEEMPINSVSQPRLPFQPIPFSFALYFIQYWTILILPLYPFIPLLYYKRVRSRQFGSSSNSALPDPSFSSLHDTLKILDLFHALQSVATSALFILLSPAVH